MSDSVSGFPSPIMTAPQQHHLMLMKQKISAYLDGGAGQVSSQLVFVHMICSQIDAAVGRANRIAFFSWVFNREIGSSNDFVTEECFGVIMWGRPTKNDSPGARWEFSSAFRTDINVLRVACGQPSFFVAGVDDSFELPGVDAPIRVMPEVPNGQAES